MNAINYIKVSFKDAWKFVKEDWFSHKFKYSTEKTKLRETQNGLTKFLIGVMNFSILVALFALFHNSLFKYFFGADLQMENIGFMWFLDWHCISLFILMMAIIIYAERNSQSIFVSSLFRMLFFIVTAIFIYLEWGDNKYAKQHTIDVSVTPMRTFTINNYNYHNSMWHIFNGLDLDLINSTLGEVYCYYRKYNNNICKNYVYYVEQLKETIEIERERQQAEINEKHKIELKLKQEKVQEIQNKQKEIEQNLKNIVLDYKKGIR